MTTDIYRKLARHLDRAGMTVAAVVVRGTRGRSRVRRGTGRAPEDRSARASREQRVANTARHGRLTEVSPGGTGEHHIACSVLDPKGRSWRVRNISF